MQECLGELNLNYCLIYMDDIVVYARTLQDHLYRLRRVFDRFREHRLKLKPSKCAFFKEEITYLGHRVSAEGVKPATINIDKILKKRPPRTYTEIREFLGMVNHYREIHQRLLENKPTSHCLHGRRRLETKDRRSTVGTGSPRSLPTIEGSSDGGSSFGLR